MKKPKNVQTVKMTPIQALFRGRIEAVKKRLPKPLRPWLDKVPHSIPLIDVRVRTAKLLSSGYKDIEAIELLERIADAYEAEQREEEICQ